MQEFTTEAPFGKLRTAQRMDSTALTTLRQAYFGKLSTMQDGAAATKNTEQIIAFCFLR